MGGKWSQLLGRIFYAKGESELRVGMLGLDNAGKTTILYQLKLERDVHPVPTIGFNVENVRCGKFLLNIWDVNGARPRTRTLWQHYNQHTRVIIFVVDAADTKRLPQAVQELRWLWWRPELAKAVFLIYANKQDLPAALGAEELVDLLNLPAMTQPWALQECCAIHGIGLWEGLQQLEDLLETRRGSQKYITSKQQGCEAAPFPDV